MIKWLTYEYKINVKINKHEQKLHLDFSCVC